MNKEFIPYEQALALKELGFNEPCFGSYDPFGSKQLSCSGIYTYGNCIAAPLYQQAFRFFREKYGLRIRNYVFVNYSGGISEGFEIFKYSKDTIDRVEAFSSVCAEEYTSITYEEVELACLRKLIEIVKEK